MSRYHIVPRESIETDRSSQEFLIPSPQSGLISEDPSRSCSVNVNTRVVVRIISCIASVVGFPILLARAPETFVPAAVFLIITLVHNIINVLYTLISSPIKIAVLYRGRNLSDSFAGQGTFRRPGIASFIDLGLAAGLTVSLPVGWVGFRWYWEPRFAVAGSVFGWIVVGTQFLVAIPALDRLNFTFVGSMKGKQPIFLPKSFVHKSDAKEGSALMTGGAGEEEATAIPAPETRSNGEPTVEGTEDMV